MEADKREGDGQWPADDAATANGNGVTAEVAGQVAEPLTVAEASAETGIPERTLRRYMASGQVATVKRPDGRGRAIPPAEVARLKDLATRPGGRPVEQSEHPATSGRGRGHETAPAAWAAERARLEAELAARDRELDARRNEVDWLRGQVEAHAAAEAEQRAMSTELARLLEGEQHHRAALEAKIIRALPAPADSGQTGNQGIEGTDSSLSAERPRPLWKRIFGRYW